MADIQQNPADLSAQGSHSRNSPKDRSPSHSSRNATQDQDSSPPEQLPPVIASSRHYPQHSPPADEAGLNGLPIDPSLLVSQMHSELSDRNHDGNADDQNLDPFFGQPTEDYKPPKAFPWALQTDVYPVSSEPTANSSSPATPGLGLDGLYHGQEWDISRQSSMSEFDSYLGATQGISTTASSESGYEEPPRPAGQDQEATGVPPPRPKKSHARKQPEGHIKRARNAFILFRKHITDSNLIPPSVEVKHQNISVVAAKMWREAPQEVRQKFQEQARIEKEEHQRRYPGRRVRKDPAEDEKVEAVAEALIKGKAGGDLEQEIKEQMVARSEASESEVESSRGSRRRRREVGQLSKGAIRAQRAQARAKQMKQNLLGANLLNMSLYNAAAQQRGIPSHPGAQHHLQYPVSNYLPMGYEMDDQALPYDATGMYAAPGMDSNDMYRLPPIDNIGLNYDPNQWPVQEGNDYWLADEHRGDYHGQQPMQDGSAPYQAPPINYDPSRPLEHDHYQLPPLLDPYAEQGHQSQQPHPAEDRQPMDPRLHEWARDGQQTPSGHVMFNERLFDGALGSAGLPALGEDGRDADLAGFDEAIAQAGEISQW